MSAANRVIFTRRQVDIEIPETFLQGLEASSFDVSFGTTEVVPGYKTWLALGFSAACEAPGLPGDIYSPACLMLFAAPFEFAQGRLKNWALAFWLATCGEGQARLEKAGGERIRPQRLGGGQWMADLKANR